MQLAWFEVRWAETIGRAITPRGILGGAVDDVELGARFADECRESSLQTAMLLRVSLWLTWFAPFWMHFSLRSFGALSQDEREALLDELYKSKRYIVRMSAMYLKLTTCTLVLGERRAMEKIGAYDLAQKPAQLRLNK